MSVQDPNAPLPVLWRYWCLVIALPPSDAGAVQLRSNASGGMVSGAAVAVRLVGACGTAGTLLVTDVAARAALPLPTWSSTASAASANVTVSPAAIVSAESRVSASCPIRPLGWAMLSMVAVVPFTATVKPVRLVTGLMLSLKVMWISVPSTEVSGLFAPVVMRVGRMPSILSPASGPTSSWVRMASTVVLPVCLMVPPLSVSLFAPILSPTDVLSFSTTV